MQQVPIQLSARSVEAVSDDRMAAWRERTDSYRDARLKQVRPATVVRELGILLLFPLPCLLPQLLS